MNRQLKFPIEIIACPIVREADGMALSSRNTRLTPEQRKNAVNISQTLFKSRTFASQHTVLETIVSVIDTINDVPDLRVEYYEVVNADDAQAVAAGAETRATDACSTIHLTNAE